MFRVLAMICAATLGIATAATASTSDDPCANTPSGVSCQPGGGRQTVGGGDKVSHAGWPAIDGIFWMVKGDSGHSKVGTSDNDELLGHGANDTLDGRAGRDVLWGDWDPHGNGPGQKDILRGGSGADFIYSSHGLNRINGGSGDDHIWAYYGRGTIDCGPGYDTARIRLDGPFTGNTKNCEVIGHFCAFGSDGHGGCKKPGESVTLSKSRNSRR